MSALLPLCHLPVFVIWACAVLVSGRMPLMNSRVFPCTRPLINQDGLGSSRPICPNPLRNVAMTLVNSWPVGLTLGSDAFTGAVYDGQYVWLVPYTASGVVRLSPSSGLMTIFNTWPPLLTRGVQAFAGGTYDGQYIWLAPYGANGVVQINPASGVMALFNSWPSGFTAGALPFFGAVLDGQNATWLVATQANSLVKISAGTGAMSLVNGWPGALTRGTYAFAGGVFDGQNVWLVPYNANGVVKVVTATGGMTLFTGWPTGLVRGSSAFNGGVYDGATSVWLIPDSANGAIRVNKVTGSMTFYNSWPSGFTLAANNFVGGFFDGQDIWMVPFLAGAVVKLSPPSGSMVLYNSWPSGLIRGANGFVGGVFDGQNLWLVPRSPNGLIKLSSTGRFVSFSLSTASVTWPTVSQTLSVSSTSTLMSSASKSTSQSRSVSREISTTVSPSTVTISHTTSSSRSFATSWSKSQAASSSSRSESGAPSSPLTSSHTQQRFVVHRSQTRSILRTITRTIVLNTHRPLRRRSLTGTASPTTTNPPTCPIRNISVGPILLNASLSYFTSGGGGGGGGLTNSSATTPLVIQSSGNVDALTVQSSSSSLSNTMNVTFVLDVTSVASHIAAVSIFSFTASPSAAVANLIPPTSFSVGPLSNVLFLTIQLDKIQFAKYADTSLRPFTLVLSADVNISSSSLCGSFRLVGLSYSCTVVAGNASSPGVGDTPAAVTVSAGTLAAAQTSLVVSVAASALAGPSGASEVQSMVIVTLARCSSSSVASGGGNAGQGGYTLVTPFAIGDTARGALAGNAAVMGSVLLVQLLVLAFLRFIRDDAVSRAAAMARFPGLLFLLASILHQSTLFVSIRMMGSDSAGPVDVIFGVLGLLVCILVPLAAFMASAKLFPRRFMKYVIAPNSKFAAFPLKFLVPIGTTLPREIRHQASSLITTYASPSPACVLLPFASSFVSNAVGIVPASAPSWVCALAMYLSAFVHLALAVLVAATAIHRFPTARVLGSAGVALVAAYHFQIASGWRGGIDGTLTAQAALTIVRSIVAVGLALLERQMQKDSASCPLKHEMWPVGLLSEAENDFRKPNHADGGAVVQLPEDLAESDVPLLPMGGDLDEDGNSTAGNLNRYDVKHNEGSSSCSRSEAIVDPGSSSAKESINTSNPDYDDL